MRPSCLSLGTRLSARCLSKRVRWRDSFEISLLVLARARLETKNNRAPLPTARVFLLFFCTFVSDEQSWRENTAAIKKAALHEANSLRQIGCSCCEHLFGLSNTGLNGTVQTRTTSGYCGRRGRIQKVCGVAAKTKCGE